jgi:guanine nucleotide-binding protein subunit alpha
MGDYFFEYRLQKYIRSYGDRENTLDAVSKCVWRLLLYICLVMDVNLLDLDLRGKFSAIHREYSPNPRKFYVFCTSVTDAATTAGIIASGSCHFLIVCTKSCLPLPIVRDMVIRQHLKQSKLL